MQWYLLDNYWNPDIVSIRDVGEGYAIKFDPLRDSKMWTAISGSIRLGDVETMDEAAELIDKDRAIMDKYSTEVLFDSATFHFSAPGNTLGTTSEYENIEIRLETQLPGEEPFIVVKTDGWSINEPEELVTLINKCLKEWKD